ESRILEVYRQGIINPEQLGRELVQIRSRGQALETRKSDLSETPHEDEPFSKGSVVDWCKEVGSRLRQFTVSERQRFLRYLVNEIIFEGSRVRIKCILSIPSSNTQVNTDSPSPLQEGTRLIASSRIAPATSYRRGRNSDFRSGIEDRESNSRARNSDCASWIENMASYTPVRNPASEVGFELAKYLPEAVTLKDKLTPEFLRRLLQRH